MPLDPGSHPERTAAILTAMRTPARRWLGWWMAAKVVALAIAVGCGAAARESPWHDPDKATPELSAVHIGDPWIEGSVADFLGPQEREAVTNSGLSWADEDVRTAMKDAQPTRSENERMLDHAGKLGVTLMGVGITIGAAVAPFFLF